jgi:hypothetical protein
MTENPFEIPQAVRDVSEQSLTQARAAYEQLMDFMTKTMGAWTDALPSNPMVASFKEVQDRTAEIAKTNADSAFALVEKIAKTQDFQEILTLQPSTSLPTRGRGLKLLDMVLCGCARVARHAATGITAVPRSWCEANGVDYIFGLAEKPPLKTKVQEAADAVRIERAED